MRHNLYCAVFFFQAEDGIRDYKVTGVQTCALPIWRAIDRMPRGAELRGTTKRGPAMPADPDRRMRCLHGFRLEHEPAELRVLAGERRFALRPQLLHRDEIFVGHGAALRERHAERGALRRDPPRADPEHEPPAA